MHLALSGPSISRKRHESVMSSAMNSNMGSGPKRSPTLSENASRPGRPPPSAPIRSAQLSSLAELANQVPQASVAAPDDDTEDLTAQSAMSAPDRDLEAQAPQANTVTSEQTDEFQQLQEQLRATQQQLQEATDTGRRK